MSSLLPCTALSRRNAIRFGGAAGLLTWGERQSAAAQAPSRLEANKAVVQRLFAEVINGGNMQPLPELYALAFLNHDVSSRQGPRPAGLPLPLDQFRAAFPNVLATLDAVVAEGDFVATSESWRNGHPPAGTHLVGKTMHLFRLANGQIVEQWSAGWDWLDPLIAQRGPGTANPLMDDSPAP